MAGETTPRPQSLKALGTYTTPPLPLGQAQTIRADPHAPAREGLAGWLNWLASFAVPVYPEQEVGPVDLLAAVPPLKALKAFATEAKVADKVADVAKGIRAYHGSPHDFDKFALEKIGTGEGAQAYGHGLYFAEHPTTAEIYRNNLAGQPELKNLKLGGLNVGQHNGFNYSPKGNSIYENVRSSLAEDLLIDQASLTGVPPDQLQAHVLKRLDEKIADYTKEWPEAVADAQRLRKELARPKAVGLTYGERPGKSYEVNINADPAHFLDWDAPVGQQSETVRGAVGDIQSGGLQLKHGGAVNIAGGGQIRAYQDPDFGMKYTLVSPNGESTFNLSASDVQNLLGSGVEGKSVYQILSSQLGSEAKATEVLKSKGVPGIKYFDQFSRERSGGELIDVFHGPDGWHSKIRVNRPDETYFTTSAPHPTREAAEQWAQKEIAGGTRNFVVFDDALIDIIRKYGLLPPLSLAALGQYGRAQPAPEPAR